MGTNSNDDVIKKLSAELRIKTDIVTKKVEEKHKETCDIITRSNNSSLAEISGSLKGVDKAINEIRTIDNIILSKLEQRKEPKNEFVQDSIDKVVQKRLKEHLEVVQEKLDTIQKNLETFMTSEFNDQRTEENIKGERKREEKRQFEQKIKEYILFAIIAGLIAYMLMMHGK